MKIDNFLTMPAVKDFLTQALQILSVIEVQLVPFWNKFHVS